MGIATETTDGDDDSETYTLGLDIGGTKLAAGVVDRDGRPVSTLTRPTGVHRKVVAVIEELVELGRKAIAHAGVAEHKVGYVGVGCGGPLDTDQGLIHGPPNLPGWEGVPIVDHIQSAFSRPVRLENDGVAAALAEHRHGAGRGISTVVYLTISTGVGGGVLIDGRPLRGRTGNGGELGHLVVVHQGRGCGCGGAGCLEAYASGTSIAARARERIATQPSSTLAALERVGAADVSAAARAGDPTAAAVWDETMAILGDGVTSLVNLFEADIVILGGGVTRAGDQLLTPVRRRVAQNAFAFDRPAQVEIAALGDAVGVVGAATAARETFAGTTPPSSDSRRVRAPNSADNSDRRH